ncbi:MAG: hypothetical protein HY075_06405, partial [Deltaproteobacteria bacterium]|nr:hypothetical protein [Deltaproteobacteria bacterium]
ASGRSANGLSLATVKRLASRLKLWATIQERVEAAYKQIGGDDATTASGFPRGTLLPAFKAALVPPGGLKLVEDFRPLFLAQDSYISYPYDLDLELRYSFSDLSRRNLYRMLVTMLLEGYAEDPKRPLATQGLVLSELTSFVVDVHDVISDLRFGPQDQTDEKLAIQRFTEANIFTSVANGDAYFGLNEGIEYMGFLGSAKAVAKPLWERALRDCPNEGHDVYGRTGVNAPCFRALFFDRDGLRSFVGRVMPKMVEAYEALDVAGKASFRLALEIAARKGRHDDQPIDSFEGENFVMVLSYIESLFKRFDVDREGQMYMQQALEAFPVVCSKLKEVSKLPGTCKPRWGLLEALFGHFLVFGEAPQQAKPDLGDKILVGIKYVGWAIRWAGLRHCTKCSYRVDRPKILSVIEALSSFGKTSVDFESPNWGGVQASTMPTDPLLGGEW